MNHPTILVTGANGLVGSAILASYAAVGPGIGLVRSGGVKGTTASGLTHRILDIWTEDGLVAALRGVRHVVHCASLVHRPNALEAEYSRFNVEGTRTLVRACKIVGVQRLIFISTIKVYGEDAKSGVLDEGTPVLGDTPYARTKIAAERIVLESSATGGPAGVVLRLCPVFGRGDKSNVRAMIYAIARRRFFLPGGGLNRKSIVHISTVAEVVRAALNSTKTGVFVVADTAAPTMRHLADTIASTLGAKRPPSVPVRIVHAAATLVETAFRLSGHPPPVTREQIRKLLQPTVCSPARVRADLGVACHVDLWPAIADEVKWLRESSLI